jgi:uncharacterized protein YebE (UPF0316 family)
MTGEVILIAAVIFLLRVFNNTLSTVRLILITRQRRLLATTLAFIESMIFVLVFANIISDLSNWLNMVAYAGGFAVGGYIGMAVEQRFITSFMTVNIITHDSGHEIALALRAQGYGVTEAFGEGREGMVTMLRSVVVQRDVPKTLKIVREVSPAAFIALEELRGVQHGWLRRPGGGSKQFPF